MQTANECFKNVKKDALHRNLRKNSRTGRSLKDPKYYQSDVFFLGELDFATHSAQDGHRYFQGAYSKTL